MIKKKTTNVKTQKATNEEIALDTVNPILTAGVVDESLPKVPTDAEIEKLNLRKKLELELIKNNDRDTITRKECWFIMDTIWLNKWSTFVLSGDTNESEPGPVTTNALFDVNGKILPNLISRIDYRGVNPLVYYIFIQLYGKEKDSKDIPRYLVDIYGIPVDDAHLAKSQYLAQKEAMYQVNKVRPQWVNWDIYGDDDDDDNEKVCCWGYVTKEHIEAMIYWGVRCCSRKKSTARKGIKYSDYKVIRGKDDSPVDSECKEEEEVNTADDIDHSSVNDASRGYDPGAWLRASLWGMGKT